MVEIGTVLSFIQAAGIIVGVAYYVMNIRISQRNQELMLKAQQQTLETRQAQMFMSIYQTDYSNDFLEALHKVMQMEIKDADDWAKARKDQETYKAWTMVASYLEGIGVLVRENLVDVRLVSEMSSGFIMWFWDRFGPGALRCREELNFPRYLVEVEYLAKRVRDYSREHPELGIASPDYWPSLTQPGSRILEAGA